MQDMKVSAAERREKTAAIAGPMKEDYPYGLRLRLGKEELLKLGIKKLPSVGDEFQVGAMAHIVSVSASDSKDGGDYASCELQITHMDLEGDEEGAENKLYKK